MERGEEKGPDGVVGLLPMPFVAGKGAVEAGGARSCASLSLASDSFSDFGFVLFFPLSCLAML